MRMRLKALILALKQAETETGVTVYAYVIMPDHLHVIAGPAEPSSHGRFMRLVKGRFAHRWNRLHNGHGAIAKTCIPAELPAGASQAELFGQGK